jgi:hypothetical protein
MSKHKKILLVVVVAALVLGAVLWGAHKNDKFAVSLSTSSAFEEDGLGDYGDGNNDKLNQCLGDAGSTYQSCTDGCGWRWIYGCQVNCRYAWENAFNQCQEKYKSSLDY